MSNASPPAKSTLFAHFRAAFVALHILAVVLSSIPAPVGGMNRSAWAEPTVARELDTWHHRLQAIGYGAGREAFEDRLYHLAGSWLDGRRAVLRPFQPYYRYLGVQQAWRMFVAPHKHPSRLQVHVRTDPSAKWELLYSHGDPEHAWRAHQFEHTRMRSALFRYSWPSFRTNYRALSRWVGREVARERPEAGQVRLRWVRKKTRSAKQVRAGKKAKTTIVRPYVTDLSGLRP